MKHFILAILAIGFSQTVLAKPINPEDMILVQGLINPKVIVMAPPQLAAVQPTASLSFGFKSCSKLSLFVETEKKLSNLLQVSVKMPMFHADCAGPAIEHKYSLQISSDFGLGTQVVLMNPTPLTIENKSLGVTAVQSDCLAKARTKVIAAVKKEAGDTQSALKTTTVHLGGESMDGDDHGEEYYQPSYEYFVTRLKSDNSIHAIHGIRLDTMESKATGKKTCGPDKAQSLDESEWKSILKIYE